LIEIVTVDDKEVIVSRFTTRNGTKSEPLVTRDDVAKFYPAGHRIMAEVQRKKMGAAGKASYQKFTNQKAHTFIQLDAKLVRFLATENLELASILEDLIE
jgi:predicted glycosyl hydrolase (DUF1957 family)